MVDQDGIDIPAIRASGYFLELGVFVIHEAAYLLPLAGTKISCYVET